MSAARVIVTEACITRHIESPSGHAAWINLAREPRIFHTSFAGAGVRVSLRRAYWWWDSASLLWHVVCLRPAAKTNNVPQYICKYQCERRLASHMSHYSYRVSARTAASQRIATP